MFREYTFEEFDGEREKKDDPGATVNPLFLTKGMAGRFKKKSLLEHYPTLASCDEDNPGRAYIESRKIPKQFLKSLYWVEDANDLFKRLPAYEEKCFRGTFGAVLIPYFSELEDGATLGPHCVALPAARLGAGATVGPASLVMRGDEVPPSTRWQGNPIAPWVVSRKKSRDHDPDGRSQDTAA